MTSGWLHGCAPSPAPCAGRPSPLSLSADHQRADLSPQTPKPQADYIVGQLRSLVTGMRVTPEGATGRQDWTRAVEVGVQGSDLPLRMFSVADVSASLLASLQGLGRHEAVLIQWVMTPALPQRAPACHGSRSTRTGTDRDEFQDRKRKLSEPNLLAVLRVAARGASEAKAEQLISRVRSALLSTSGPDTKFTRRFVTARGLMQRIDQAAGVFTWPIQLSVLEAAALIAWPVGDPFVAGLPQVRSRHLPPTGAIARTGLVVGDANMPGAERPLAISIEDSNKHLHIVGPTGTGKTVLLRNLAGSPGNAARFRGGGA